MIAYVVAPGGAHKGFLNYFLDRYSSLTPTINSLPFSENGTAHVQSILSGKFQSYHPEGNPVFMNANIPHVIVTINLDDLLFLERIVNFRGGDYKQNINTNYIKFNKNYIKDYNIDTMITNLFDKKIDQTTEVPKFVLRDLKKLMFLDPNKNGFIAQQKKYIKNLPTKCFQFPLSAIWSKNSFFEEIKKCSDYLDLSVVIDDSAELVYDKFLNNIKEYPTKNRMQEIVTALQNKQPYDLTEIDTIEQAYLSAYIEKNNDYVIVPLQNAFFKNTLDIVKWLEYYPKHYKAMNPNLPTFNNIPNPFHLWNLKK